MNFNKKIAMSSLVASMLVFTGCGGGGVDTGASVTLPTSDVVIDDPIVVDATLYSGLGATDVAERHQPAGNVSRRIGCGFLGHARVFSAVESI